MFYDQFFHKWENYQTAYFYQARALAKRDVEKAALQTRALELCRPLFEEFVGLPYDESELYYSALTPTQEGWEQARDRKALCILLSDEPVADTLRGARR